MNCKKTDEASFLSSYNVNDYDRPSVATDVAVFSMFKEAPDSHRKDGESKLHILLVKRGEHPFMNKWALPGGFLKADETIEACALREVKEETNVSPEAILPVGIFSDPQRDPRARVISAAYASVVNAETVQVSGGSDALNAKWFYVDFSFSEDKTFKLRLECEGEEDILAELKEFETGGFTRKFETVLNTGSAFDHAAIIATALYEMRSKAENYEITFKFLPRKFTLADLQRVQETLMGISLLTANFRRKIATLVEETDEYTEGIGHRPARLFKRKEII